MFLINWQSSLITFGVIIALYLLVVYRKPGTLLQFVLNFCIKVSFRRELGIVDSSPDLQNGSDHGAPPHQHRRARQELQTADFSSVWFPLVEAGTRRLRQFDHQKQFSARRWRHHRGTTTTSPLLIFVSGECPCRRGFNTACDPLESKLSTPG
jgi:hypothetical protein